LADISIIIECDAILFSPLPHRLLHLRYLLRRTELLDIPFTLVHPVVCWKRIVQQERLELDIEFDCRRLGLVSIECRQQLLVPKIAEGADPCEELVSLASVERRFASHESLTRAIFITAADIWLSDV